MAGCRVSRAPGGLQKEMGSDSPKPDPVGHSRGLPQSFTRSQKERPLGEYILAPGAPPLVANTLRSRDEFETGQPSSLPARLPFESLFGHGHIEFDLADFEH